MAGRFAAAFLDEASRFDRGVLFWWLLVIAPIGAALITTGLFQDWQMRDLPIAACDLDGFDLSRAFIRHAGASPSPRVAYEVQSEEEGLDLLRSGAVYAVLIIPRHLGRQVMAGRQGGAVIYADGQRMPVGPIIRRDLVALSEASWRQAYSDFLMRSGGPPEAAAPMSATISIDLRAPGNPALDYRIFLCHGFLTVLCSLMYLIYACARIKMFHAITPSEAFGRAAAPACFMLLVMCLLLLSQRLTGTTASLCPLWKVASAYALMIAANCMQAVFISSFCATRLFSLMMVSAMASPAMAFAGLTFPVGYMSAFARWWASMLPVTHAITAETAMASQGAPASSQVPAFAALLILIGAYGALGAVLCAIRSRTEARHEAS